MTSPAAVVSGADGVFEGEAVREGVGSGGADPVDGVSDGSRDVSGPLSASSYDGSGAGRCVDDDTACALSSPAGIGRARGGS